jgi:hypothetical protein
MIETIATALCEYAGSPRCESLCEFCLAQASYILDAIEKEAQNDKHKQPVAVDRRAN